MGSKVEGRLRLFFLVRARGNIWPSSALQSMQNVWEKTCAVCAALGAMPSSLLPSSFSPTANIFAEKSVNPLPPKPFERIFDRPPTAVTLTDSTFLSINGYKSESIARPTQISTPDVPSVVRALTFCKSRWRLHSMAVSAKGSRTDPWLDLPSVEKRAVRLMVISRFHLTLRDPLLRRSLSRGVINLGME